MDQCPPNSLVVLKPGNGEGEAHRDAVIRDSTATSLADGRRVLQSGACAVEYVQKDLPAVAAKHVADDL